MADEERVYKQRLLNVAKALRESPTPPADFTMDWYSVPDCGTPSCALGHYAYRADLQDAFAPGYNEGSLRTRDGDRIYYYDYRVRAHFGLDADEAKELFSGSGCDNAKSAVAAATYIEAFVARKYSEVA